MSSNYIKAAFEAAIGSDHTGVSSSYADLGNALSHTARSIVISSSFNQSVFLSIDGSTNHIFVPSTSVISIDFSTNRQGPSKLGLAKGTQFSIKQGPDGAPTSGDLYISVIYGRS